MKTLTITSLAAASLIGLAVAATAQPATPGPVGPGAGMGFGPMAAGPAGGADFLKRFDLNGDGKITKEEIETAREKNFAAANTDGTDGVTLKEFEPWFWQQHRQGMVRAFQHLDRDGDGKITETEVKAMTDAMFARFDRNGDGVLSADDRPAAGQGFGRGFGRGPGMGPGYGGHGHGMGPGYGGHGRGMGPGQGWGMGWDADGDDAPAK